jgi:hypothetical protein
MPRKKAHGERKEISSVFSVFVSVAKVFLLSGKDWTVSSTKTNRHGMQG